MRPGKAIARAMLMDDEAWRRHANRWSVRTRLATVPALALAVHARVRIGWYAAPFILLGVVFLWLNTRIFAPGRSDVRWEAPAAEHIA